MWIGTIGGAYLYNSRTNTASWVKAIGYGPIKKLLFDAGTLYGLSFKHGAFALDTRDPQAQRVDLSNSVPMHDLAVDADTIWILGKDNHLQVMDRASKHMRQTVSLSGLDFEKLFLLKHNVWLTRGKSGIGRVNRQTLQFHALQTPPDKLGNITASVVQNPLTLQLFDHNNNRWILDDESRQISHLGPLLTTSGSSVKATIRQAILDKRNNIAFIGRNMNELFRQNRALSAFTTRTLAAGSPDTINNLITEPGGTVYVATDKGLFQGNNGQKRLDIPVKALINSGTDDIWLLTGNGQIARYNPKDNQFSLYDGKQCRQLIQDPVLI